MRKTKLKHLLPFIAILMMCSCTLLVKNIHDLRGNTHNEVSLSIAPIIRMERYDELHTGDKHRQTFFGTAPLKQTSTTQSQTTTEQ